MCEIVQHNTCMVPLEMLCEIVQHNTCMVPLEMLCLRLFSMLPVGSLRNVIDCSA